MGIALHCAVALRWQPTLERSCLDGLAAVSGAPEGRIGFASADVTGFGLTVERIRIGALSVDQAHVGVDWGALFGGRRHPLIVTLDGIDTPFRHTTVSRVRADLADGSVHATELATALPHLPLPLIIHTVAMSRPDAHTRSLSISGVTVGSPDADNSDGWAGLVDEVNGSWRARLARDRASLDLTFSHGELHALARFERLGHLPPAFAALDLRDAHLDGTVQVDGTRAGLTVVPRLVLDDAAIDQPSLSPVRLLHVRVAVTDGAIELLPVSDRLTAHGLVLELGALHAHLDGALDTTALDLDVALPTTPCQTILAALPPALVPTLDGLAVDGTLGARAQAHVLFARPEETRFSPTIDIGCKVVSDPPLADVHALLGPFTRPAIAATPTTPAAPPLLLGPPNADFRALDALPERVVTAFLDSEDMRFYAHHGFDAAMIERAVGLDVASSGFHHGASTISQQLVKNAFLSGQRTLARKLEEAVLTWRLEQVVPKRRILELYLSLVELGPEIYGITQGAEHYFGKEPEELSVDEAAQLAALLPAPRRGLDAAWRARYELLKARLIRAHVLVP